jgi:GT2 family glycosyltransferase
MNPSVHVAVCTNRDPAGVAAALEALSRQVDRGSLAVVASGLREAEVDAHRRVGGALVLAEPRSGLSRARNRALAWAADQRAELIAFVDDDAVVVEGWLDELRGRWLQAPAEVACIGGPIRPRFEAPPPAWYSDEIAAALTVLDRGPEVLDLDPAAEAVYGANISFRVEALRRIGGFDPAFGHAGERVFFSEEDEAQRALARLGYRTRYVPDAAAWHVIPRERLTRESFLRRRFAYGAALGLRGGRSRSLAAKQLLRTGPGALLAVAQGRDRAAMVRAVRAAENAGVLAAPLMARRARA